MLSRSTPPVPPGGGNHRKQVLLIGLITIVTLAAAVGGFAWLEQRMVALAGEAMALVAADIAAKVDVMIREREGDIQIFAETLAVNGETSAERQHLVRYWKQVYPVYQWIGVADATGRITEATDPATQGLDIHETHWFKSARLGPGEIHIDTIQDDRFSGGHEAIAFTALIINHRISSKARSVRGVVSTRVDAAWVDEVIKEALRSFQQRTAFTQAVEYQVLQEDGTAFIDSIRGNDDVAPVTLSALLSTQLAQSREAGFVEEPHLRRNIPVLTGYARTQGTTRVGGLRWTVLLRMDRSEVVGPVRGAVWMIAAACLLIIGPLVGLLVRAMRRAQYEWQDAQEERSRSQANERRLSTILEVVPEGLIVLDDSRQVRQVNPAGCGLFDARFPEELLGHDLVRFLHDEDRHAYEHAHTMALQGRSVVCKGRLTGLIGETRWFEMTLVSLPAEHGGGLSVLTVANDITEQRHAERRQALQHAVAKVLAEASTAEQALPELLRVIATSLEWQVGQFWRVQDDARLLACTESWGAFPSPVEPFLAASRRELFAAGVGFPGRCWVRGEPIWESDVLRDQEFVRLASAVVSGLHAGVAFPVWLRTNVFGIMEFFSREVQPRDADLLRTLATIGSQIGLFLERAEVEAALRENETRTRLIIDTALDAVVTMDQGGLITEWNAQAEHLFGWHAHEVIGRDLAEILIPSAQRAGHRAGLARYLDTGQSAILGRLVELQATDREGRVFPVEVSIAPLRLEGTVIFSAFIRDISKRKEAEQALSSYANRLEQSNRDLDEALVQAKAATEAKTSFLATMSHEIRTPMNGVIGMTSLLLETELTPEQREYAGMVSKCGDHLLRIINDILDFSKIEAGKLNLEQIEFNLRETVEDTLEVLSELAASKRLNLACWFASEVPSLVLGDPGRIRQVMTNLVGNAIKFTERGDVVVRVGLQALTEGDAVLRFEVVDSGIGLSAEQQARLFQAFSQADGSTTRRYGGTGLGLAICKRLVELMGGEIGVTSQPGVGSTFWFSARFQRVAAHPAASGASRSVLEGVRVLVVDEREVNRNILVQLLTDWGAVADTAGDGSSAMRAIQSRSQAGTPYTVVLVDSVLSLSDGRRVADALMTAPGKPMKVILLRPMGRLGQGASTLESSPMPSVSKPIREEHLYRCLVDVVSRQPVAARPMEVASGGPRLLEGPTEAGRWNILVAEDHQVNQQLARRMLGRLGHQVTVVANGLEAVHAVSQGGFDMVLMDCQMPEMDGFQATRVIREWEARQGTGAPGRRIPVIAMTADVLHATRAQCVQAGMDDCVFKPVAADVLAAVVERWGSKQGTRSGEAGRAPMMVDGGPSGNEAGYVQTLARHFLADTPKRIQTIGVAVSRGRTEDIHRMVHTLKRNATALRLTALVGVCERMLAAVQAGTPLAAEVTLLVKELETVFAQVRGELERDLEDAA